MDERASGGTKWQDARSISRSAVQIADGDIFGVRSVPRRSAAPKDASPHLSSAVGLLNNLVRAREEGCSVEVYVVEGVVQTGSHNNRAVAMGRGKSTKRHASLSIHAPGSSLASGAAAVIATGYPTFCFEGTIGLPTALLSSRDIDRAKRTDCSSHVAYPYGGGTS